MTKIRIIGEEPANEIKEIKKIEFEHSVSFSGSVKPAFVKPCKWDNIELISKRPNDSLDVMFAFDDGKRAIGCIYLGKWNGGVVE